MIAELSMAQPVQVFGRRHDVHLNAAALQRQRSDRADLECALMGDDHVDDRIFRVGLMHVENERGTLLLDQLRDRVSDPLREAALGSARVIAVKIARLPSDHGLARRAVHLHVGIRPLVYGIGQSHSEAEPAHSVRRLDLELVREGFKGLRVSEAAAIRLRHNEDSAFPHDDVLDYEDRRDQARDFLRMSAAEQHQRSARFPPLQHEHRRVTGPPGEINAVTAERSLARHPGTRMDGFGHVHRQEDASGEDGRDNADREKGHPADKV